MFGELSPEERAAVEAKVAAMPPMSPEQLDRVACLFARIDAEYAERKIAAARAIGAAPVAEPGAAA